MDCDDQRLLEAWIDLWRDLDDFEIIPVMPSSEAAETIAPRL